MLKLSSYFWSSMFIVSFHFFFKLVHKLIKLKLVHKLTKQLSMNIECNCRQLFSVPKILNGVYWTQILDDMFKENTKKHPTIKWQYFCSSDGFFRVFPGIVEVYKFNMQPSIKWQICFFVFSHL